jgi:hypothetical protein
MAPHVRYAIDVIIERVAEGSVATVRVEQRGARTQHRVTVTAEDLRRYGATDVADLVRRSFEFLLEREPNTSILREFRITEIERYFPEFREAIKAG